MGNFPNDGVGRRGHLHKKRPRAARGAVRVLSRDLENARQDLSDPRLDGFAEAALWRGAVMAELGE